MTRTALFNSIERELSQEARRPKFAYKVVTSIKHELTLQSNREHGHESLNSVKRELLTNQDDRSHFNSINRGPSQAGGESSSSHSISVNTLTNQMTKVGSIIKCEPLTN